MRQTTEGRRSKVEGRAAALILLVLVVFYWVQPAAAQVSFSGGYNSILGFFASGGWGFRLRDATTLTLGATFSETLGLEPLVALTTVQPLRRGWNATATFSRGGLGGDYRVDRIPELSFSRSGSLGGPFSYGVDAGVGNYIVRPVNITGIRTTLGGQVQLLVPVTSVLSLIGSTGYRYNFYDVGTQHSGWWLSSQLSIAPTSWTSMTFTYFSQDHITGTSPLLFDGMGREFYVVGRVNLRLGQTTVFHSQKYDYLSLAVTERFFGVSYSAPGLGALSLSWEALTQRVSFGFSR